MTDPYTVTDKKITEAFDDSKRFTQDAVTSLVQEILDVAREADVHTTNNVGTYSCVWQSKCKSRVYYLVEMAERTLYNMGYMTTHKLSFRLKHVPIPEITHDDANEYRAKLELDIFWDNHREDDESDTESVVSSDDDA